MVEISTSILNVNSEESMKVFYDLETAHTDYFHIDVMDGKFVEADTVNVMEKYAEYLRHITLIPLDVHLMVENVKEYIDKFLVFNPNIITFHLEAFKSKEEILDMITYIKNNNCRVGIAIKPNTKVEEIFEFLPFIHQVLVMTVEPGKGGQKFIYSSIERVKKIKEYITNNNLDLDIEVDGGINKENSDVIKEAGANIIVSGTAIVNANNYKKAVEELKK